MEAADLVADEPPVNGCELPKANGRGAWQAALGPEFKSHIRCDAGFMRGETGNQHIRVFAKENKSGPAFADL